MDRAFGLDIPVLLEEACRPERTALIIYDMQVGIVRQIPAEQNAVANVREVLDAARAGGFRVFFTRHMSLPNEVAGASQLRTAMAWQRVDQAEKTKPAFPRDSPQFQIVPELAPRPTEAVFDKITMSAFAGTPLDLALRDCRLDSFVIVGIALEIGIEPTVRHALDLGYLPILAVDACGWRDAAAVARTRAQLDFIGGTILTDRATVIERFRSTK
jgi:nicotinamidase-related amidase